MENTSTKGRGSQLLPVARGLVRVFRRSAEHGDLGGTALTVLRAFIGARPTRITGLTLPGHPWRTTAAG
ncbi:hypothetical protein GCM10017581_063580 [Dactylosporangium matsuzakiense]|uniref:Uncharacterized protein n=1 Tax=Dactylosporangium matsuzakiense TaxID=53360 RepID=A0A9W6KQI0_9ACTN|nr:hypothetical protein GCM10017581_063580 [Dactylosporangium matsuzakiense]